MKFPIAFTAIIILACLLVASCAKNPTDTLVEPIFRECAGDDLTSGVVLYFGPSNRIGPGSVWSRLSPEGGYQLYWLSEDLDINASAINRGSEFECNIGTNVQLTTDVGLSVLSRAANASGEVQADFSRATTILVNTDSVAWDTIIEGRYMEQIKSTDASDKVIDRRRGLLTGKRLVMRRALKLSGYKATLDFDAGVKPQMKAKYDGVILGDHLTGEVGAQLKASWTSAGRLELNATAEIYVAGEFVELINGEFVAAKRGGVELGSKKIVPYNAVKM